MEKGKDARLQNSAVVEWTDGTKPQVRHAAHSARLWHEVKPLDPLARLAFQITFAAEMNAPAFPLCFSALALSAINGAVVGVHHHHLWGAGLCAGC
jgi:hypothetical protein